MKCNNKKNEKSSEIVNGANVIENFVIKYDYCCGCGVCAGVCPSEALKMRFNENGLYRPYMQGNCINCELCLKSCPFNGGHLNEDLLGEKFFKNTQNIKHTPETGYYLNSYVGHICDPNHLKKSASGGMATWFLGTLLKQNIVDHVICVLPNPDHEKLFRFDIVSRFEDIIKSAKSAYYPVELSQSLKIVKENPGRYAVIGLPCAIKAIRLLSINNKIIKDRITVCAGLTCGHTKGKGFTDVLIRKLGEKPGEIINFHFRSKEKNRGNMNLFLRRNDGEIINCKASHDYFLKLWPHPFFKQKSCNFCDDIFAELSDIVFMDARLPEYAKDKKGVSFIITRSALSNDIIQQFGIDANQCRLNKTDINDVTKSQADVIAVKRNLLGNRLWLEKKKQPLTPNKRVKIKKPEIFNRFVLIMEEKLRLKSFSALQEQQKSGKVGIEKFQRIMALQFFFLKLSKKVLRLKNRIRVINKTKKV